MTKYNLILIFLFFLSIISSAQTKLKFNIETGLHFDLNDSSNSAPNSVYRIAGMLKYKNKNKNSLSQISIKVRPEILNQNIGSLKINPKGTFFYFTKDIIWKSLLSIQHNSYYLFSKNSYYNTFTFINGAEFNKLKQFPLILSIGYSYQNIDFNKTINSDFLFINIETTNHFNNYFYWNYGIFIQNFTTKTELRNRNLKINSTGWMYGPQIKLHYLKKIIIDAEYKFLLENSNFISYPSYEHQIKLLAGFMLNKKFTFFLLADLYIRRIKLKNTPEDTNPILYSPTKNENQLYLKTAYSISRNTSLYFKTGYFSENLFLNNFNVEGINIFLGFEYKN